MLRAANKEEMYVSAFDVCPANATAVYNDFAPAEPPPLLGHFLAVFSSYLITSLTLLSYAKYRKIKRTPPPKHQTPPPQSQRIPEEKPRARKYLSASSPPVLTICPDQHLDPSLYDHVHLNALAEEDLDVEQENLQDYKIGGYKPIVLGELLGNRYKVLRKLGFGHFSTVWLCKDTKRVARQKYVAVKVVKAAATYTSVAKDEIKLLKKIMTKDALHIGRHRIIEMIDFFQVRSVNGQHHCITFELMGPSLLHLIIQSEYCGLQISAVKNIIRQVLHGLTYLHEACNIIHTDLKPENILICVRENYIQNLVATTKRFKELAVNLPRSFVTSATFNADNQELGNERDNDSLEREYTTRRPGSSVEDLSPDCEQKPMIHNRTVNLGQPMPVSQNLEVKIADLGNACWADRPFSSNIQTKQYRALEVILGADYSYPADIWSVGCLAFELATGEYLFNPKTTQSLSSHQDHVLMIYELLGGIPNYIAQRGRNSYMYFDNSGNLNIIEKSQLKIWKTEDVLVDKYRWKRVDAIPFAQLIESMIEPDPELRVTASGAIQHTWLQDSS